MEFKDYYQILGVEPTADEQVIKTAYRRLARKYHPDVSKEANAEDKFKDVAEAYEVLKDAGKRIEYDELRKYGGRRPNGHFEAPPGWQSSQQFGGSVQDQGFSDFFEQFFGGHSAHAGFQAPPRRGKDVEMPLSVHLQDTLQEHQQTIHFRLGGEDKKIQIKVPQGVREGEKIRLKGQGHSGHAGAEKGDLYLVVHLVAHPQFDQDGENLILTVPIAPWEAALGGKITVPTLTGKVQLTVPANSQSGQRMRVKGKGLNDKKGNSGDLYVVLNIVMPTTNNETTQELWQQLAQQAHFDPRTTLE